MTDMFVLLLLPGGGDELQGIKRGIMELADLILINKADDELQKLAERSAGEYRRALRLLHPRSLDWKVDVRTCSSRDGEGIAQAWEVMLQHNALIESNGQMSARRSEQARDWMWSEVNANLLAALQNDPDVRAQIPLLEAAVIAGKLPPVAAAKTLLEIFLDRQSKQV